MLTAAAVRQKLAAACQRVGSENAWAKQHGLSQAYVNAVIRGGKKPGPSILRALGLETGYGPANGNKQTVDQ